MKPKIRSNLHKRAAIPLFALCMLFSALFLLAPQVTQAQRPFNIGTPLGLSTEELFTSTETITITKSGWYFVEAWGGDGGNGGGTNGGKGGVSILESGYFYFNVNDQVTIQVGSAGGHGGSKGTNGEGGPLGTAGTAIGSSIPYIGIGHSGGRGGNATQSGMGAIGGGGSGGGGGGAASGIVQNGTIIIASGGGGGGGGEGGSNLTGQRGGNGGGSNSIASPDTQASSYGDAFSTSTKNGWPGGWSTRDFDGQDINVTVGTSYGGGGAGGGGGGWNGSSGGGGKSGAGGKGSTSSAGDTEGGGGGAGGQSAGGNTSLPTHIAPAKENLRNTAPNGQVYITFLGDEYTVLFDDNGGTGGAESEYPLTSPLVLCAHWNINSPPYLPATVTPPTKTGYTFEGYFYDLGGAGETEYYNAAGGNTKDWGFWITPVTLKAKWTQVDLYVTYNYDGGAGTMVRALPDGAYAYNATVTADPVSDLVKANFTFDGWIDQHGIRHAGGSTFSIKEDMTLTAVWACKITYDPNGGTGSVTDLTLYVPGASVTLQWAGSLTPPTPPPYMVFVGWTDASTSIKYKAGQVITIAQNMTLVAEWAIAYTVTYLAGEGTGTLVDPLSPYAEGAAVKVLDKGPGITHATKTFVGWEDQNGLKWTQSDKFGITEDMTLTALWINPEDFPVPVFKVLQAQSTVGITMNLSVIDIWNTTLTEFYVDGTHVPGPSFTPIKAGTYLIEARNVAGTLKIWKYVKVN